MDQKQSKTKEGKETTGLIKWNNPPGLVTEINLTGLRKEYREKWVTTKVSECVRELRKWGVREWVQSRIRGVGNTDVFCSLVSSKIYIWE